MKGREKVQVVSVERRGAHVLRGLDSTVPSSVTIPTPTLLAEPSIPSTLVIAQEDPSHRPQVYLGWAEWKAHRTGRCEHTKHSAREHYFQHHGELYTWNMPYTPSSASSNVDGYPVTTFSAAFRPLAFGPPHPAICLCKSARERLSLSML